MSQALPQALLGSVEVGDGETVLDLLDRKRRAVKLREEEEIVAGRLDYAHYMTGVTHGLRFAIDALDEDGSA